ncbi:MAG: response regulator [Ignavibacteriae bacterium]|nr:response regulator [Ignavibacteriota bacterium]
MKINAKLLLLTFTIITLVSVTSAFIYHTLTKEFLLKQQSKNLINSANDFIFTFQQIVDDIDSDFQNNYKNENFSFSSSEIDFIVSANIEDELLSSNFKIKPNVKIYTDVHSLKQFYELNRNLIIRQKKNNEGYIYFGKIINSNFLTNLAEKIRSDIALVDNGVISLLSNNTDNEQYLPSLSKAARELNGKSNFELFEEDVNNADLFVTHFSPAAHNHFGNKLDFIVFSISNEASTFSNTMNLVTLVIVLSGISLTIVFLFLFTTKFRKQLEYISNSVSQIAKGKLDERVKIILQDEIGNLGSAFNNMLEEIKKRDDSEKEYTEFISLINKKPALKEIGEVTIEKIILSTGVDIGGIYLLENNLLMPLAVYGIPHLGDKVIYESSFYKRAIDNKEIIEIEFENNHPIVRTGLTELKINYLYILPISYNYEVIAILELASVNKPQNDVKQYYEKIKDQLSIGIANGKAFSKLQNLVDELQQLNNAYQKQNIEITEKNIELLELHDKLKKGAEELEIQKEKAVESAKLKSQFLANMSHELRTPQNSILGLTELILKDTNTDSKTKERLNVVLRNGKKLLNLIENILEFSKLESGNIVLTESEILLSDFINEVKSFISPIFLEREISFNITIPNDYDYLIKSDIKKIEQIIYNLVGNAAKFTKEGFVNLKLHVNNNELIIEVEDSGPGISDEDKKIIFEEFRQADASLNRKFSGTGLGLAICKKYTNLLRGEINVISELAKGSKFIVRIPNTIKDKVKNHVVNFENTQQKIFKAVIISDGEDSIKLIGDYLKSNNVQVEIPNVNEFNIITIEESFPDVIILDVLLKNRNGWQLLQKLKENNFTSNIPIVLINMDEEANCGLGFNIYDFAVKDLTRLNVINVIENIEKKQSIKFRKILFVTDEQKYSKLEEELIHDELKTYQTSDHHSICENIKKIEPDLIIIDQFNKNFDSFILLNEIQEDIYSKNIPVVSFIQNLNDEKEIQETNNKIFETTLIAQHHPLDVLKIIKDRIELIDASVFKSIQNENIETSVNIGRTFVQKNYSDSYNILVVDDDKDARFTIGEIIKSLGYNPIFAEDGFECLEILKNEKPDIVLLDIMMPKMDGFQTIKKIRNNPETKTLRVFALTAYAMLSDREIIEKNGFNGLFTKPVNTGQLEKRLKNIFKLIA